MECCLASEVIALPQSEVNLIQGDDIVLQIQVGSQTGHFQAAVLFAALEPLHFGMDHIGRIDHILGLKFDTGNKQMIVVKIRRREGARQGLRKAFVAHVKANASIADSHPSHRDTPGTRFFVRVIGL